MSTLTASRVTGRAATVTGVVRIVVGEYDARVSDGPAALARMAGNVVGLFHDGDTLEWPVCTGVALIAAAILAATVAVIVTR